MDLSDLAYRTDLGEAWCGDALELLELLPDSSVNLVMTSPPFALQRQKSYGNKDQAEYLDWLMKFARAVHRKLADDGSFVIDVGGAYQSGIPSRSLYNFRLPLRFCDEIGYHLAEDFYWYNPSKLPSPIEWVNKRKIRAKDSVNNIWWFSKTAWPKADVTKVLTPYSGRMEKLIANPDSYYAPKVRPSGHDIGRAFAKNNGGALPSNLLQFPNTESNSQYLRACKECGVKGHPARFPPKLPEFFIKMLTDEGDLVVDIFAGSNTTGQVAESLGRRWKAYELSREFLAASAFRFASSLTSEEKREMYQRISTGTAYTLAPSQEFAIAAE